MDNEQLIKIATMARKNAFAPITNYTVGAALLAESGTVYIGTNIEVPSGIGISNCAERVAIQNAYTHGERKFKKIAIVGANKSSDELDLTLVPCGVCLQFINEMCKDVDIIYLSNGNIEVKKVKDFLVFPCNLKR